MILVEIGTGEEFRLVNVDSSLADAGDSWGTVDDASGRIFANRPETTRGFYYLKLAQPRPFAFFLAITRPPSKRVSRSWPR